MVVMITNRIAQRSSAGHKKVGLTIVKAVFSSALVVSILSALLLQQKHIKIAHLQNEIYSIEFSSFIDMPFKKKILDFSGQSLFPESEIRHSVLTRFMIGQSKQTTLARARLELFKAFCYPTMYHQTSQNYYWLVLMDSGLDQRLINEVAALLNEFPSNRAYLVLTKNLNWASDGVSKANIDARGYGVGLETVAQAFRDGMVEVRTGDTQLLVDALQWRERRKPLLVLETLLDADDGLHRKAIESFQSIAMERFSKQIKTWIKSPIDGGVPLVTMKETWWVLCANDHLEWHNRDIFRIYKNVYDAQGIQSGVLGQRESSSECISAGYTRIGYTNDFEETDSATFPRKTDMNFQLATAILPPCNQTSLNCFVRVFHEVSLAISTRTIASDSLSHMDPESAAYAEKSKGIIDTEFKVTEYLWRILSQDFFIGRRQAQVVSNTLYNLREEILNENSHGRCVTGFPCQNKGKSHLKKLTKALQGRKHFNLEQPTILSLHDTEEPAMQKRHQCIEAIRERQFSLIGDLIRSSMENLSGNRIEKAVLMFPAYHANVGDHMITLGEIQFLRRLGIDHPTELLQCGETGGNLLPNCAEQDFWLDDKFQAHRKPALFHGGGNWGDIWRFHQNRRISTIQNFVSKNFTFVGMPQSLYYENDKLKKTHAAQIESALSASKTKNEHPMTFLWREQYSFDQASELYPTADNVLFPDIAFQLGPYAPMHPPRLSANTVDILVFMRLDKESVEQSNRHDTSIRFILTSLAGPENAQKISFRIVDWKDQMDIFETDDWLFSELSIQLLSLGHVLICDRLHASILAYISGIPFVYIDQMTGKISKTLGVALNSGLEGCSDGDTSAWAKASDLTEALQMAVNYLDTKSFGGPKQQLLQNGTVIFKPMS